MQTECLLFLNILTYVSYFVKIYDKKIFLGVSELDF